MNKSTHSPAIKAAILNFPIMDCKLKGNYFSFLFFPLKEANWNLADKAIHVLSCCKYQCENLFLVRLNILNVIFKNKPRFHAEANFDDILAPKIHKTAALSDLI